jgi:predicted GIY-YIG superfamily endonuclease
MTDAVPNAAAPATHLYRHFDNNGTLLYVGISLSTLNRLAQHREHAHWFTEIKRVEIERFQSRQEALSAERAAIQREKPLHNLKRPSIKEQKAVELRADESRADLLQQFVRFNPIYSLTDAARFLQVSTNALRHAIENGDLSAIELPARPGLSAHGTPWKPRLRITGWQLIDYIETLQARAISKSKRKTKTAQPEEIRTAP